MNVNCGVGILFAEVDDLGGMIMSCRRTAASSFTGCSCWVGFVLAVRAYSWVSKSPLIMVSLRWVSSVALIHGEESLDGGNGLLAAISVS